MENQSNSFQFYLVKPCLSAAEELYAHMSGDPKSLKDIYAPDHQLFVPPRAVFGHFSYDKKIGLTLSRSGLFYSVSWEELRRYEEQLKNKKLEIVREGGLTASQLSLLINIIQTACRAQKNFIEAASSLLNLLK